MSWQPPPYPGQPGGQAGAASAGQAATAAHADLTLYQLLQIDRDAHVTIIRYAYRFLAAMYHPDNTESGNAEKFRIITDAWKTLSDEGKRAAYDMSLKMKEEQEGTKPHKPQQKINEFGKQALPHNVKTGVTWNEIELRVAVLQIMLSARKKNPRSGGVSMRMILDVLGSELVETEFCLWYLREKDLIEVGERVFQITGKGLDYLVDQLSKTQVLDGGTEIEKKTATVLNAGLPAVLNQSP